MSQKERVIHCGHCKEEGHNRRGCPELGKGKESKKVSKKRGRKQRDSPVKCGNCSEEGHTIRTCPELANQPKPKSKCSVCGEEGHNKNNLEHHGLMDTGKRLEQVSAAFDYINNVPRTGNHELDAAVDDLFNMMGDHVESLKDRLQAIDEQASKPKKRRTKTKAQLEALNQLLRQELARKGHNIPEFLGQDREEDGA